ncbi:MAG: pyridoxal 5'-phosphate synthase glutaminase subunit PdxT [Candidatus Magasanikbacteria bacterium CG_4_10_14_0_2_um_filter_37_12]|uniref:Pyridoxal 5'-phosphate synthase subunit PdxT n=1 Tax=Candidatus Magasanikbacteria bacterium CG_4_10_14_0_2_um_filter_37_12 TaxID=1974637 RepID=A0A2M7V9K6_9BACT|nr:MAG: pyridoxal 5'-phosphate synthase glutaminase subunit PdxT [Candidatus Magasanikbacteria bacterium CG_4_10_14_0_2_um_filter_37_12]
MTIGVLAIQGSVIEHLRMLDLLSVEKKEVRTKKDFDECNALIIPGGESTTMLSLLAEYKLDKLIIEKVKSGMPIYGTCAGMIVLANLGLIGIEIKRNAYGSQLDSFETVLTNIKKDQLGVDQLKAVFIRAPQVTVVGTGVDTLAQYNGHPVLLKQKNILVSSFHPELTDEMYIYKFFLDKIVSP